MTPIAGDILDILFKCNWRNAMLLEEYLIMRRRDEIRLEKGEPAALMDGPRHGDTSTSAAVPTHLLNHTEPPVITEIDEQGRPIKDDNKKYGTFFGKQRS